MNLMVTGSPESALLSEPWAVFVFPPPLSVVGDAELFPPPQAASKTLNIRMQRLTDIHFFN
ncbi:hypothetical protein D3C74_230270 [compost metagenome]